MTRSSPNGIGTETGAPRWPSRERLGQREPRTEPDHSPTSYDMIRCRAMFAQRLSCVALAMGFARRVRDATRLDPRVRGVPRTKGML